MYTAVSRRNTADTVSRSNIKLERLDTPKITIGKAGAIVQALPTVTRFWDKLGLSPRSGTKDVHVFVLYEDSGRFTFSDMENWLGRLSEIYKVSIFQN